MTVVSELSRQNQGALINRREGRACLLLPLSIRAGDPMFFRQTRTYRARGTPLHPPSLRLTRHTRSEQGRSRRQRGRGLNSPRKSIRVLEPHSSGPGTGAGFGARTRKATQSRFSEPRNDALRPGQSDLVSQSSGGHRRAFGDDRPGCKQALKLRSQPGGGAWPTA